MNLNMMAYEGAEQVMNDYLPPEDNWLGELSGNLFMIVWKDEGREDISERARVLGLDTSSSSLCIQHQCSADSIQCLLLLKPPLPLPLYSSFINITIIFSIT